MLFSKIIKKKFDEVLGRYEENPAYYAFGPDDFEGLHATKHPIMGDHNVELQGYFYSYEDIDPNNLVVFDHGIGEGHRAYFKEIETLCKKGYTVYSYDHTGCATTGGNGILGFAQGVNDLDHVLCSLQKEYQYDHVKLVGHSWGAYSAMNVVAFHPEVTHVVSLAGFLSATALCEQYIPKPFLKYSSEVMEREREHNPKYADLDARESLLQSKAKLLHLQSKDDKMVLYELSLIPLSYALKDRSHTTFMSLENRNHGPQLCDEAAKAYDEMKADETKLLKKHQLDTKEQQAAFKENHNWSLITKQDPHIWNEIFTFLQS